jgi:DnaJ-class molecular chaperone
MNPNPNKVTCENCKGAGELYFTVAKQASPVRCERCGGQGFYYLYHLRGEPEEVLSQFVTDRNGSGLLLQMAGRCAAELGITSIQSTQGLEDDYVVVLRGTRNKP